MNPTTLSESDEIDKDCYRSYKKHPCPDCRFCQQCSEIRCHACRETRPRKPKLSFEQQIALYNRKNQHLFQKAKS